MPGRDDDRGQGPAQRAREADAGRAASALSNERYRLKRELGRGGMGAVWLAWDEIRQQDVALKRAFDPRPDALLRFKREFRVVEQLRHPNLVRVFELGEDADGLFFTMEVIDGEELDRWCQDDAPRSSVAGTTELGATRPEAGTAGVALDTTVVTPTLGDRLLTPRSAPGVVSSRQTERTVQRLSQVLPQLLDALALLHGLKIVHCDLKPALIPRLLAMSRWLRRSSHFILSISRTFRMDVRFVAMDFLLGGPCQNRRPASLRGDHAAVEQVITMPWNGDHDVVEWVIC